MTMHRTPRPAQWEGLKAPKLGENPTKHLPAMNLSATKQQTPLAYWSEVRSDPFASLQQGPYGMMSRPQTGEVKVALRRSNIRQRPPFVYQAQTPVKFIWDRKTRPNIRARFVYKDTSMHIGSELEGKHGHKTNVHSLSLGPSLMDPTAANDFQCGCLDFHYKSGILFLNNMIETELDLPDGVELNIWFSTD